MCKIINFTAATSPAYNNLSGLFAACESVNACNLYLDMVERSELTESELLTLRRVGRQKKQELLKPSAPGVYTYHPEIGEKCPPCQISASLGYYGDHWYLDTALELKGRGIRFIECRGGISQYTATHRAYDLLKEKYTISMECLLD